MAKKEKNRNWEILPDGIRVELEFHTGVKERGTDLLYQLKVLLEKLRYVRFYDGYEMKDDPEKDILEVEDLKPFSFRYHGTKNGWKLDFADEFSRDEWTCKERPNIVYDITDADLYANRKEDWKSFCSSLGLSGYLINFGDFVREVNFAWIEKHLEENLSGRGKNPNSIANLRNQGKTKVARKV